MMTQWAWTFAVLIVIGAVLQRGFRSKQFRSIERKLGFRSAGSRAPEDFPIKDAPFYSITDQVSNVSIGDFEGRRTMILDYHANHGDVGYKQSIVAFKSSCRIPSLPSLWRAAEIRCLRLGAWIAMYREREEVPVGKIENFVSDCSELMREIEARQGEFDSERLNL
ncbi:hypothetical protein DYQ86_22310 [Acidobacteria bacterium AB60]|nr:hypothetical protein DYQ86_22310 [Acidobacteria bacterium AB60]